MPPAPPAPIYQRNALAPSLLAAIYLFVSPLLTADPWPMITQFVVTIFAVIVGWYAFQAHQWWLLPILLAIAVLWNPAYPIVLPSQFWTAAAPIAAIVFLAAGALIKIPRDTQEQVQR